MTKTDAAIKGHEAAINGIEIGIATLDATYKGFVSKASEYGAQAESIGYDMGMGVAEGIRRSEKFAVGAAGTLAEKALGRMKTVAMIQSPSKRARKEIGQQIGQGEVLGLEDKIPDVKKASEKLVNAIDFDVPSMDIPSVTAQGESDTRINAIIAVLNKYLPKIGAPIVLDTGELVGATIDKFDHELGVMQQRRARYE